VSGDQHADQCPFCDAPWGDCVHAKLLAEWEAEALAREAAAGGGKARAREAETDQGADKSPKGAVRSPGHD
jgi:hypothetical protein